MSGPLIALGIIAVVLLAVVFVSSLSVRGILMDPQQYMVAGRSFGPFLLWLLMAGEIYTTFTFLGGAGWAYSHGAPAFYILCYGTVAYIISFFLAPAIWRVAKKHNLLTGADFFATRYGSKALGVIVAIVGFVFLVPYVTLQLSGLEILLHIAGYGSFNAAVAVSVAFIIIAFFVFTTGIRGTAWASVAKDALVLLGVIFAGIVLPIHFFGSPANVITKVLQQQPDYLTLPHASTGLGTTWFVSTVLLTSLGFFMWPQSMQAIYSAKNEDSLRRNAVFLPVYQLMLLLVYFAGFTALLVMPGLKGPAADQSFMLVVQKYFSPFTLGALASAGCLAGLIPASAQILAAASLITKNVMGDWLGIATTDRERTLTTRILVLVVAALSLFFWLVAKSSLVGLLLMGYNGVTQFFPGVVLAFAWKRTSAWGVGAGIVVGVAMVAYLSLTGRSVFEGVNSGFAALILNAIVCVVVSLLTPAPESVERGASVAA